MRENIHEFATTGGILLEAVPVETWPARASEKFDRRVMKRASEPSGVADIIERSRGGPINYQFAFVEDAAKRTASLTDGKKRKRRTAKLSDEAPTVQPGTTTLDRVHIAMLLQAAGKSNALRTMLKAEGDRGPDFLRLANAFSALYPKDSEEKRLLDAMLLAMPRLGEP
jgi:hypothetical protein